MDEAKERAAFEAWAKENGRPIVKDSDQEYRTYSTWCCWVGWKARAKLMLTLPVKDATGEH